MRHSPARLSLPLLALALLASCSMPEFLSYPPQVRGNLVDQDQIGQLVPGTSTRQDVTALLGSPTAKATFDDNTWLYISQTTKPIIGGFQGVENQQVYALSFDAKGVLTRIDKRTQSDSLPMDMVSRTTPSPGTEATWLQQLLGNVGRFSAASSSKQGQQGTSSNPGNF